MQTPFTSGPWKVVQAFGYKIKAADGQVIADLPTHCPLTWESPANAHLIAAAPDLFAACRLALGALHDESNVPEYIKQALQEAIAEVEKRTVDNGRSPAG